ncbi:MAG: hypothetical protein JWQ23_2101 [Herminiimonas sp.]|nr:hypothetical protein [Herminiimonas sp.]
MQIVKSRDGKFKAEKIGNQASGCKFSKVQIGMTMGEVSALIGAPDDMARHETGKRWIPFYAGMPRSELMFCIKAKAA